MIAMIAAWVIVRPNVGPTDRLLNEVQPKRLFNAELIRSVPPEIGLEEIWKASPLEPTCCTTGSDSPAAETTDRSCETVAGWTSVTSVRAPEVKSIPRFSPRAPIASAPTSRITPDIEKNHFDAP